MTRRLSLVAARHPELADSRNELLLRLTEIAEESLLGEIGDDNGRREAAKRRLHARAQAITTERAREMLDSREADWSHDTNGS